MVGKIIKIAVPLGGMSGAFLQKMEWFPRKNDFPLSHINVACGFNFLRRKDFQNLQKSRFRPKEVENHVLQSFTKG